jgi:hypothetical protein
MSATATVLPEKAMHQQTLGASALLMEQLPGLGLAR